MLEASLQVSETVVLVEGSGTRPVEHPIPMEVHACVYTMKSIISKLSLNPHVLYTRAHKNGRLEEECVTL